MSFLGTRWGGGISVKTPQKEALKIEKKFLGLGVRNVKKRGDQSNCNTGGGAH